jgi:hypothetical protein
MPWGGHGTQHPERQNEWASKPSILPGWRDTGRRGAAQNPASIASCISPNVFHGTVWRMGRGVQQASRNRGVESNKQTYFGSFYFSFTSMVKPILPSCYVHPNHDETTIEPPSNHLRITQFGNPVTNTRAISHSCRSCTTPIVKPHKSAICVMKNQFCATTTTRKNPSLRH